MHETAVRLLRAASGMVGGNKVLAHRLGIDEALLARLMSGQYELPERVLLGTVDIILENHESRFSTTSPPPARPALEPTRDG